VTVDATYTTPVLHNNPMEPHATMAIWAEDGELTVYDSTQGPSADRDTIAATLGLPPERVRVVAPHMGGGFGSKGTTTTRPHAIVAALAARIIDPDLARSQFIGGMTMGLGMALMEQTVVDTEYGDFLNHDFAQYHNPACADVQDVDAVWIDERDAHLNPMGSIRWAARE
jgi:CO/xanthine dehydrogenase Mo-binding subunit